MDSTPDISHVDELAICVRYVSDKDCAITDRFLGFVGNAGHKAAGMFDVTITTLENFEMDIMNCWGQSYDTASNMSGTYNGLQAKIVAKNPLVHYVPCSRHSFNLVGEHAVSCCSESSEFFYTLQFIFFLG